MFNPQKHKQAGQSIFMSSVTGLANVLAFVVTFVGAPPVYSNTINPVLAFTASHYGYGLEDITSFVWAVTCGLVVFFIARASISTALVMGGLAIATRLL